jgi:hypothetical protein
MVMGIGEVGQEKEESWEKEKMKCVAKKMK